MVTQEERLARRKARARLAAERFRVRQETLTRLRKSEPKMQKSVGMMRACEISLIADVAQEMDLFISLGCGPYGCDMLEARKRSEALRIVGFERMAPRCEFKDFDIEYRQVNLWESDIPGQIGKLLAEHGRSLVYCDNGRKLMELQMVSPLLKSGDIVGVHDYAWEVPEDKVDFLREAGFVVYQKTEPWIKAHYCLQRFWIKES